MSNHVLNQDNPLRIAILGGSKVGKSCYINNLIQDSFQQTHYPTLEFQPNLFKFQPQHVRSRMILNEFLNLQLDGITISNIIKNSITKNKGVDIAKLNKKLTNYQNEKWYKNVVKQYPNINSLQTKYYSYYLDDEDYLFNNSKDDESINEKIPKITPMIIELIDSPSFNPNLIVPFLELSLNTKLTEDFLHNLNNSPRVPVATKTLLVGTAAGELNGFIDGYVLMYSAIPSDNPPGYFDNDLEEETSFDLISKIMEIIYESWKNYKIYKTQNKIHGETDIFSISSSIKHIWNKQKLEDMEVEIEKNFPKNLPIKELEFKVPIDELEIPSILIICTNCDHELASPKLIENGEELARKMGYSFVKVDNETKTNIEESICLMIRDIIEKKKLSHSTKKKKQHII